MRKNGEVYEYIACYVDDLCIAAKDPNEISNKIQQKIYIRRHKNEYRA